MPTVPQSHSSTTARQHAQRLAWRPPLIALLLAGTCCAFGCQHDPRTAVWFEKSNAEKRFLEEQLYEWQFECERLEQENARLADELDQWRSKNGGGPARGKSRSTPPPSTAPDIDFELEAPEIDMGTPRPSKKPEPLPAPERQSELPDAGGARVAAADVDDVEIAEIYVNPFLTGGHDFDGQAGDDGLTVVVEPRDADGKYVPLAGDVSLVLLDPQLSGEKARVARWDLDAVAASQFVKDPRKGRGIHLELKFPGPPPQHPKLKLVVRYLTVDGRELEQWHDLVIDRPGQIRETWSPRSEHRVADDSPPEIAAAPPRELPRLEPPRPLRDAQEAGTPPRPRWQPVR